MFKKTLAAFALMLVTLCGSLNAKAADDTIKVGILHSLSGTMAISETTLKDVMLMLIDEQNKKGGLLGKKLEPVVVDPASNWPLFAEKARELMENGDKKWMVQVALAANQANADAVVSKLRAKGYKVTTSQTTKGIRIMVGPAKDRDVADAARKKISSDESLNMKGAWVIDWVPLEQR